MKLEKTRVPKRWHVKFRHRGITGNKEYNKRKNPLFLPELETQLPAIQEIV